MKPILFSSVMVQAILEGRKTMTRRIIKQQPEFGMDAHPDRLKLVNALSGTDTTLPLFWKGHPYTKFPEGIIPHAKYQVGDILYVRETYFVHPIENTIHYRADEGSGKEWAMWGLDPVECKWKPSLFMPKAEARIFLEVTGVRAEKLGEITEQDAEAEGIEWNIPNISYKNYMNAKEGYCYDPITSFQTLWQSINKEWNPEQWVWVYSFKKVEKPVA